MLSGGKAILWLFGITATCGLIGLGVLQFASLLNPRHHEGSSATAIAATDEPGRSATVQLTRRIRALESRLNRDEVEQLKSQAQQTEVPQQDQTAPLGNAEPRDPVMPDLEKEAELAQMMAERREHVENKMESQGTDVEWTDSVEYRAIEAMSEYAPEVTEHLKVTSVRCTVQTCRVEFKTEQVPPETLAGVLPLMLGDTVGNGFYTLNTDHHSGTWYFSKVGMPPPGS